MSKKGKNLLRLGIYDSGLGGLSIVRTLEKIFPACSIVYLADRKNVPYGDKTKEQIISFSKKNASFLLSQDIDGLLIACHTSSVYAAPLLRETLTIPLFDLTSSTLRSLKNAKNKRLVLLGTQATIRSGVYQKLILDMYKDTEIISCACPSFAPLVEAGEINSPFAMESVRRDLLPLMEKSFDGWILGCTHFPYMMPLIEKIFPGKFFIDPALEISLEVKNHYRHLLLSPHEKEEHFFVTQGKNEFTLLAEGLLGRPLKHVEELS